ncbi:hypothetical protein ABW19_dt0205501 [Dactylella cylindrospora]|nr:hypothetical protein ABW19_dt0205501 [Dactylella cylindrospora]
MKFNTAAIVLTTLVSAASAAPTAGSEIRGPFGLKIVGSGEQASLTGLRVMPVSVDEPNKVSIVRSTNNEPYKRFYIVNAAMNTTTNTFEGLLAYVQDPAVPGGEQYRGVSLSEADIAKLKADPLMFTYAGLGYQPKFGFGKMNAFTREGQSGWYVCDIKGLLDKEETYRALSWYTSDMDPTCVSVGVEVEL